MNKTIFNEYIDQGYNHIPVFREVVLDTDTALGLYLKLANNTYSYLFESVQGGEKWGRYSIIGLHAQTVIKVFDYEIQIEKDSNIIERFQVEDPLAWIEQYQQQFKVPEIADLPEFNGGLVGYFGYEIIRYIEPKLKDIQLKDELNIADILLMVSNDLVVFDNLANKAFLLTHVNPEIQSYDQAMAYLDTIEADIDRPLVKQDYQSDNLTTQDFSSSFGEQNYKDVVEHIQRYIVAGDVMQVVPSQRLSAPYKAPSVELYRQLRRLNPSPYMYYLNLGDVDIIGSSPEILTRVDSQRRATVRPIAGTRARGKDPAHDLALEKDLLADEKEIAEHLMLIDLGRNDLGRIAKTGSVKLTDKMFVERYSHVMHIVSNVECDLKDGMSAMDALKATFPAGTH
jgi:anthranilate synthase component I